MSLISGSPINGNHTGRRNTLLQEVVRARAVTVATNEKPYSRTRFTCSDIQCPATMDGGRITAVAIYPSIHLSAVVAISALTFCPSINTRHKRRALPTKTRAIEALAGVVI